MKNSYIPFNTTTSYPRWHYICKSCGSTKSLKYWDVKYTLDWISKKVAKEEALNGVDEKYKRLEYHVGCITVSGQEAQYAKRHYRNINQDKAIPYYS